MTLPLADSDVSADHRGGGLHPAGEGRGAPHGRQAAGGGARQAGGSCAGRWHCAQAVGADRKLTI